jgi:hypothetical protein
MCFFVDPSPVRRVLIPTGIQRKLKFVSVRTIKGSSSSPTSAAARSRPPRPPPPLWRWPQQQQRSGVQQQRRAPGSSSGERRAAAATESSLVQARTSSFKANIDPQPPSTVVEMARQQSGDQVRSPQRVGGHGVRPTRKTRQPRTRKTR